MMNENVVAETVATLPGTAEKMRSAMLIGAFAAGSGVSFYVASEAFSNKLATVSLGLVALSSVPEMVVRWRNMCSRTS
jgi:hypothetical protein